MRTARLLSLSHACRPPPPLRRQTPSLQRQTPSSKGILPPSANPPVDRQTWIKALPSPDFVYGRLQYFCFCQEFCQMQCQGQTLALNMHWASIQFPYPCMVLGSFVAQFLYSSSRNSSLPTILAHDHSQRCNLVVRYGNGTVILERYDSGFWHEFITLVISRLWNETK